MTTTTTPCTRADIRAHVAQWDTWTVFDDGSLDLNLESTEYINPIEEYYCTNCEHVFTGKEREAWREAVAHIEAND